MYSYYSFNLVIKSELFFPELLPCSNKQSFEHAPITIKYGAVNPHGLGNFASKGAFYQVSESALWLHVPSVARFLISNGEQITIDAVAGVCEDSIRVFILGSCLGALLIQRGLFLLHGNAIKIGNNCISFVGNSGAGKSTLSGAFLKRGYSILADDICAVSATGHVIPAFPQIKLWFDAAKHLNINTQGLRKIRPGIEKFAVPLAQQFHREMLPLKMVYVLHSHNKDDFKLTNITGMHKLPLLQKNTYRKIYLKGPIKDQNNFKQCSQIANQIDVVRILRPSDEFKLDELVTLIEQDLTTRRRLYAS